MNIFEITIQRKSESSNEWPVVVEQNQPGVLLPIRSEGSLQLTAANLEELHSLLGHSKHYGTYLGKAIFKDQIGFAFIGALQKSVEGLRILLFIEADDPELRAIRWERLCAPIDGGWYMLRLDQRVPFSLYLPSLTDRRFPPIGKRDLRALVVVASPDNSKRFKLTPFDVESTVTGIYEALGDIPCDVLATVTEAVGPPTLDELCQRLTDRNQQYTLLHFVCHSRLVDNTETVLYLANADNQIEPVPSQRLLDRLHPLRGPRGLPHFAFLSTCETAGAEAEGALRDLGQRLVRDLGMPAVVAITEQITNKVALRLEKRFYRQLKLSGQVDLALDEALIGLGDRDSITFPVLFSRLGERPLFSDSLDRPLTNAEIKYGLDRLQTLLEERAPVLVHISEKSVKTLHQTLATEVTTALSPEMSRERQQALKVVNEIAGEILDMSFNALALDYPLPAYDPRCPFRGLYPFRRDDQEFFFGRESLIEQLQQHLLSHHFLALLGPSGSGKSSLVLAGLIPLLQKEQPQLQIAYLTPNNDPLKRLETSLLFVHNQATVIVVDQFEELFTLCSEEAQRIEFIKQILTLAQTLPVIITMRADFWGECAPYTDLTEQMETRQKLIAPMNTSELRKAMEMQAKKVGLRFEADLSNMILDEVKDEPGAMPLLQHALLELWKRRHGRWLRAEEYRAIGGVQRSIAKTADEIYHTLSKDEQEQCRDIFIRLTRLDDASQGEIQRNTRRRVWVEELVPVAGNLSATKRLVKRLADEGARLVVTSIDSATGKEAVEVAHEALIRYWPKLQNWLTENHSQLQMRETIRQAALAWQNHDQEESYLVHRGGRLEDAEFLLRQARFLNQLEANYVNACATLRDKERAEKEEQQRQKLAAEQEARRQAEKRAKLFFWGSIGLFALLLIAVGAGMLAWYQKQEAEKSEIKALSISAKTLFQSSPFDALLAGLTAAIKLQQVNWLQINWLTNIEQDNKLKQQVYSKLQQALYWVKEYNTLKHNAIVSGVAFSPEGNIASITNKGTVNIWKKNGLRQCTVETGQQQYSQSRRVSFSWDGKKIAVAGKDKTVTLWKNDDDCTAIPIETKLKTAGDSVVFSFKQPLLVTSYTAKNVIDNKVKLWKPNGHSSHELALQPNKPIYDVSFSEDLLALAHENTVMFWNWQNDSKKTILQDNKEPLGIRSVALYPKKEKGSNSQSQLMILTVNENRTVNLWQTVNWWQSDMISLPIKTWEKEGTIVRFNPKDGTFVTADSTKTTLKLWRTDGHLLNTLSGHQDGINTISFTPDGLKLASGSYDQTVKLWRPNNLVHVFHGHKKPVHDVRFSPDNQVIATISLDNTVRLWNKKGTPLTTKPLAQFKNKKGEYLNNLFFLDNRTLIASFDGEVKIWKQINNSWELIKEENVGITTELSLRQGSLSIKKPENQLMATTHEEGGVRFWQWDGERNELSNKALEEMSPKEATKPMSIVAFDSDGTTLASASKEDHTITLWKANGTHITTFKTHAHNRPINDLRFNPKKPILASASRDTTVKLWQQKNGRWQYFTTLNGHEASVRSIAFRADGQMLASVDSQGKICFWQPKNGFWHNNCHKAHRAEIREVRFSENARLWASASADKTIKLWHQNGTLLTTLTGHTNRIWTIDFSSDGKTLASSSYDNTIILWDLELIKTGKLTKLIAHGCQWIKDYLDSHSDVEYPLLKKACPSYLKTSD